MKADIYQRITDQIVCELRRETGLSEKNRAIPPVGGSELNWKWLQIPGLFAHKIARRKH
jgi:hypothetical protein